MILLKHDLVPTLQTHTLGYRYQCRINRSNLGMGTGTGTHADHHPHKSYSSIGYSSLEERITKESHVSFSVSYQYWDEDSCRHTHPISLELSIRPYNPNSGIPITETEEESMAAVTKRVARIGGSMEVCNLKVLHWSIGIFIPSRTMVYVCRSLGRPAGRAEKVDVSDMNVPSGRHWAQRTSNKLRCPLEAYGRNSIGTWLRTVSAM